MIISGVTREDLEAARDVASAALGNQLIFTRFDSYSATRHVISLQVKELDAPGARLHLHSYYLGYAWKPRRSRRACGHAFGAFLTAIFERAPGARVQSTMNTYSGYKDFLEHYQDVLDTNVGSVIFPIRFGDLCNCPTDEIDTSTLEEYLWRAPGDRAVLPNLENTQTVKGEPAC
jgi:hypothetical protein